MATVRKVANHFLKHPPHESMENLQRCSVADGRCYDVSDLLRKRLKKAGCDVELIEMRQYRGRNANQFYSVHHVVKFGNKAIDLTGAQFKRNWAGVRIVPMSQILKEWNIVYTKDPKWRRVGSGGSYPCCPGFEKFVVTPRWRVELEYPAKKQKSKCKGSTLENEVKKIRRENRSEIEKYKEIVVVSWIVKNSSAAAELQWELITKLGTCGISGRNVSLDEAE